MFGSIARYACACACARTVHRILLKVLKFLLTQRPHGRSNDALAVFAVCVCVCVLRVYAVRRHAAVFQEKMAQMCDSFLLV